MTKEGFSQLYEIIVQLKLGESVISPLNIKILSKKENDKLENIEE